MTTPRTFLSLLSSLPELAGRLLGTELALLKAETSDNARSLASVLLFAVIAIFSGLLGLIFVFLSIGFLLIKLGLATWVAWAVIAVLWFIVAVACGVMAKNRMSLTTLLPERTITQLKADMVALHQSFTHV